MKAFLAAAALLLASLCSAAQSSQTQSQSSSQTGSNGSEPVEPGIAALQDAIAAARASAPEGATDQITVLDEAERLLTEAQAAWTRAGSLRAAAGEAAGELLRIRSQLQEAGANGSPEIPDGATLAELERGQENAAAALTARRAELSDLQAESSRRRDRRTQAPEASAAARQQLDEATARLGGLESRAAAPDDGPELLRARASAELARATIGALDAEIENYNARRDLLPARIDLATRRVEIAERTLATWRERVSRKRAANASADAQQAATQRREAARQSPAFAQYAERTETLAATRASAEGIPSLTSHADSTAADRRTRLADVEQLYRSGQRRISVSGLNRATGLLLRRHFAELPDLTRLRRSVSEIQSRLTEAEYELIERQDERAGAGNVDSAAQDLARAAFPDQQPTDESLALARSLAEARRDLLDELVADSTRYLEVLFELDRVSRELLETAETYDAFIRERIFWVESVPAGGAPTLSNLSDAWAWVTAPSSWTAVLDRARERLREDPVIAALLAIAVLVSIATARAGRRRVAAIAPQVTKYRTDRLWHTYAALLATILIALPLPLALVAIGWLFGPPDVRSVPGNVSQAFLGIAALTGLLSFARAMLRKGGLATAHFRWGAKGVKGMRQTLTWLMWTAIPPALLSRALGDAAPEAISGVLGRAFFTLSLVAVAVALLRLFRPGSASNTEIVRRAGLTKPPKFWWLVRFGLPLVPIGLIALSWMGYAYTAQQLVVRIELTLALALVLIVLNGMLLRWLFVARRRVAVEAARRKREAVLAEAENKAQDTPTENTNPIDEEQLDLPAISAQTKQLFRAGLVAAAVVGLFVTWAEVLPALRIFDRVEIFPELRVVDASAAKESTAARAPRQAGDPAGSNQGAEPGASGAAPTDVLTLGAAGSDSGVAAPGAQTAEAPRDPVTLGDLGIALILLVVTIAGFRNLPGLVEILVLQRLPLDAGSRYALSTVLRYAIAITGVILAFGAVNLDWGKIQWLAAAFTFGLAFGLQEIFANFVSGLIILAERPIRLGDTVTVGGVTGTVTRIKMRATTVADWDRKELIIPNKNFITGEVINWSLSDPVLRIIIPVGVSYGSDVDLVEKTLVEVAKAEPLVIEDPKAYAVFREFGDSTLNFQLRVYIASPDNLVPVTHALHMQIAKAFRKAGIEIAFPQRDLHIRSTDGIERMTIAPKGEDGAS